MRQRLIAHLEGLIEGSDAWPKRRRDEFVGSLKNKPGLRRLVWRTTTGLLRIDRAAAAREAHYDGKWLLGTSDLTLTAEDLAAAYQQLIAVERGWRDCKTSLGLRPVYHHRDDRIRAHVQLCWLALLLIRVAETRTGHTWRNLRHELDRMHLVTFATADGRVAQRSALTGDQKTILAALDLPEPPNTSTSHPSTRPRTTDARPELPGRVVTRPESARPTSALVNAEILRPVCPLSAEVGPFVAPASARTTHHEPHTSRTGEPVPACAVPRDPPRHHRRVSRRTCTTCRRMELRAERRPKLRTSARGRRVPPPEGLWRMRFRRSMAHN